MLSQFAFKLIGERLGVDAGESISAMVPISAPVTAPAVSAQRRLFIPLTCSEEV